MRFIDNTPTAALPVPPSPQSGALTGPTAKPPIKSICVYCGSGTGLDPAFMDAARTLGRHIAEQGLSLVYGGGNIGLMGEIARTVINHGGHVTGIIPEFLRAREVMLQEAQETVVVPDMHTRKRMMYERADAFVALPGGIGTLEELIEQLTWSQLGQHSKPILVLNIQGFWKPLLVLLEHMRDNGFIRPGLEVSYIVVDEVDDVIPALKARANGTAYTGREARADPLIGQHF